MRPPTDSIVDGDLGIPHKSMTAAEASAPSAKPATSTALCLAAPSSIPLAGPLRQPLVGAGRGGRGGRGRGGRGGRAVAGVDNSAGPATTQLPLLATHVERSAFVASPEEHVAGCKPDASLSHGLSSERMVNVDEDTHPEEASKETVELCCVCCEAERTHALVPVRVPALSRCEPSRRAYMGRRCRLNSAAA